MEANPLSDWSAGLEVRVSVWCTCVVCCVPTTAPWHCNPVCLLHAFLASERCVVGAVLQDYLKFIKDVRQTYSDVIRVAGTPKASPATHAALRTRRSTKKSKTSHDTVATSNPFGSMTSTSASSNKSSGASQATAPAASTSNPFASAAPASAPSSSNPFESLSSSTTQASGSSSLFEFGGKVGAKAGAGAAPSLGVSATMPTNSAASGGASGFSNVHDDGVQTNTKSNVQVQLLEGEEIAHSVRTRLLRFKPDTKGWGDLGVGTLRIQTITQSKKSRVVFTTSVGKTLLNARIFNDKKPPKKLTAKGKSLLDMVCIEADSKGETVFNRYLVKVKTSEQLDELFNAFVNAKAQAPA